MGNSESVLLKKDCIKSVNIKTYETTTRDFFDLDGLLHRSNLKGFIPFRLSKIENEGIYRLTVRTKRNGDISYLKKIDLYDSQEPLFSDQKTIAKMFEEFLSVKSSSIKKAIEKNKDADDFCLLICGVKEEGEKAMRIAIAFFSWLFETFNLSYSEADMVAFSTDRRTCQCPYVRFCVVVSSNDIEMEEFLLSKKENEGGSSKHLFKFVMKIENFSKVEFKEAKLD